MQSTNSKDILSVLMATFAALGDIAGGSKKPYQKQPGDRVYRLDGRKLRQLEFMSDEVFYTTYNPTVMDETLSQARSANMPDRVEQIERLIERYSKLRSL